MPPVLLITGSSSRSVPPISDESRENVPPSRKNAQPMPRPDATRKIVSAMYATSELRVGDGHAAILFEADEAELMTPDPTTASPS